MLPLQQISLFLDEGQGQDFKEAKQSLVQRLESVPYIFSCGDLIFEDDEQTGNVIGQRLNLTCHLKIETVYYNVDGRGFKTPDICVHCVAEGSTNFLFYQAQLEEQRARQKVRKNATLSAKSALKLVNRLSRTRRRRQSKARRE